MKAICSPTPTRCTYRDDPNVVCCWTMTSPQLHIHLQFPLTRCRSSLLLSQHAAGCLCHWAHSWYHSPSTRVCVCFFLFISVSALVSWLCVCECVTDTLAPRCLLLQHSCRSVREHSCPIWSSSTEFLVCCWFCRHNTIVVLWRPEFNTEEDAFNWQPIVLSFCGYLTAERQETWKYCVNCFFNHSSKTFNVFPQSVFICLNRQCMTLCFNFPLI